MIHTAKNTIESIGSGQAIDISTCRKVVYLSYVTPTSGSCFHAIDNVRLIDIFASNESNVVSYT